MIRIRAGFGFALFILVVGGCDYWRNLVEDHGVSRGSLTLRVRDAWTDSLLPGTLCRDSAHSQTWITDNLGQIQVGDITTGPYQVSCELEGYYPASASINVGPGVAHDSIALARLGGLEWYPKRQDYAVSIVVDSGNFRVPGNVLLGCTPGNLNHALKYVWTFSNHSEFNRTVTSPDAAKPILNLKLNSLHDAQEFDTATITVFATLAGHKDYVVGSNFIPIQWSRNKPPSIKFFGPAGFVYTGCGEGVFDLAFQPEDPDGRCVALTVTSDSQNSSIGAYHFSQQINNDLIDLKITIPDKFATLRESGKDFVDSNLLRVRVWDDNGAYTDSLIPFVVLFNKLPEINFQSLETQNIHFSHQPMHFKISAHDTDSQLARLTVDWGDQSTGYAEIPQPGIPHVTENLEHIFNNAGSYQIKATIYSQCSGGQPASQSATMNILIRDDSPPAIALLQNLYLAQSPDSGTYALQFSVADADIETGYDRLSITIRWGDGGMDTVTTAPLDPFFRRNFNHTYRTPATDSAYHLTIVAVDAFAEQDQMLVNVPAFK